MIHRRPPKLSLLPQLTKDTIDTAACQSILLLSMLTKRYHRWSPPQGNCKCRHPRKLSDAVTRQSTHHHRHLPRLSLTFPSSKAIADSAVLQSNHECCHPLKLSSMVFPTSPIMAGRTNHPLPAALSIYLPPGLPLNLSLLPPRAEAIGPASRQIYPQCCHPPMLTSTQLPAEAIHAPAFAEAILSPAFRQNLSVGQRKGECVASAEGDGVGFERERLNWYLKKWGL